MGEAPSFTIDPVRTDDGWAVSIGAERPNGALPDRIHYGAGPVFDVTRPDDENYGQE